MVHNSFGGSPLMETPISEYPLVIWHNSGKSTCLLGKLTISMAIFHSYVSHCQRVKHHSIPLNHHFPMVFHYLQICSQYVFVLHPNGEHCLVGEDHHCWSPYEESVFERIIEACGQQKTNNGIMLVYDVWYMIYDIWCIMLGWCLICVYYVICW